MPSIPVYDQRTDVSGAGLGAGPDLPASSGVGEGLQDVGSGIQSVVKAIDVVKERDAATWSAQALSQSQATWLQELDNRKLNAPAGAPGFTPSFLKDFDTSANGILSQAPTVESKKFMQERFIALRGQLSREAATFEATSRIANNTDIAKNSIDAARNELQVLPQNFSERLAERRTLIDGMALPPKQREAVLEYAQRSMAHDAVSGVIAKNPYVALKALNSAPGTSGLLSVEALHADDRLTLRNEAESEIHRLEVEARLKKDRIEAVAERALNEWDRQTASGVPATPAMREHWDAAIRPSSYAPEIADRLASEQQVQTVLRQPIADQVKYVQDAQAKLDTGGGSLQEAANLQRLRSAVSANVKTLQTDPLIFNANRLSSPVAPLDISKLGDPKGTVGAQLSDRISTLTAMRRQYGDQVPMRPLLPQEAAQVTAALNSTSPNQASQLFGALRNAAGSDEAYTGIMQQIAPDSPVKALAGLLAAKQRSLTLERHWFSDDVVATSPDVSATMLTGESILNRTKPDKATDGRAEAKLFLPDSAALQQEFTNQVGTAFAGRPGAAEIAFQAAQSYYVGKSAQTGKLTESNKTVDEKLLTESVRATLGQVVDYNGKGEVFAPWGMNEAQFEDRVSRAFQAELKVRGMPIPANFGSLGLRNFGENTYYVTAGRNFVYDNRGEPLVIDLRSVPAKVPFHPQAGNVSDLAGYMP